MSSARAAQKLLFCGLIVHFGTSAMLCCEMQGFSVGGGLPGRPGALVVIAGEARRLRSSRLVTGRVVLP